MSEICLKSAHLVISLLINDKGFTSLGSAPPHHSLSSHYYFNRVGSYILSIPSVIPPNKRLAFVIRERNHPNGVVSGHYCKSPRDVSVTYSIRK